MPRRPAPEPLSPRALARLRSSPHGFVPTPLDLTGHHVAAGVGAGEGAWSEGEAGVGTGTLGAREGASEEPAAEAERGGRHTRVRHPRAWARLPTAFVGARWQPGRSALVGVLVVVVLAAAVFGLRVLWAQSAGGGTVIAPGGGSRAGPAGVSAGAVPVGASTATSSPSAVSTATAPAATAPAAAAPTGPAPVGENGAVVVVHVVGHVRRPGVRQLAAGSRVADAVTAAGGATSGADLSLLNLARLLLDGEQVRVPAHGDPPETTPGGGTGAGGATGGAGSSGGTGAMVSLNTADATALDTLPGVGPVLAQRILDWRAEHGRFTSIDELGEVSGIGEKLLAQLSPLVTL